MSCHYAMIASVVTFGFLRILETRSYMEVVNLAGNEQDVHTTGHWESGVWSKIPEKSTA